MDAALRVLVVTVSDRASRGEYEDLSGPAVEDSIRSAVEACIVDRVIVSDDREPILHALGRGQTYDAVLTTGGTGIGPRDITPEITEAFCEREVPGIAEMLRSESRRETELAPLSRGYAGQKGNTLYVNLPGSTAGARSTAGLVAPLLVHARVMLAGGGHTPPP